MLLLPLLLPPAASPAQERGGRPVVLLVRAADTERHRRLEQAFRARLDALCRKRAVCPEVRSSALAQADLSARYDLIVAAGRKAAGQVLERRPETPQLHLMVSMADYEDVEADRRLSVLYREQPAHRLLALARFLLPDHRRVGALGGPASARRLPELRAAAESLGLDLHVRRIERADRIGRELHQLNRRIDVLQALPDPLVYNRRTLSSILLVCFRDRVPVLGFSAGMVRAGALAALHATPEGVGAEAAERVLELLDGGPAFRAPARRFTVSVNRRVARALHLQLPTDREIEEWRKGLTP